MDFTYWLCSRRGSNSGCTSLMSLSWPAEVPSGAEMMQRVGESFVAVVIWLHENPWFFEFEANCAHMNANKCCSNNALKRRRQPGSLYRSSAVLNTSQQPQTHVFKVFTRVFWNRIPSFVLPQMLCFKKKKSRSVRMKLQKHSAKHEPRQINRRCINLHTKFVLAGLRPKSKPLPARHLQLKVSLGLLQKQLVAGRCASGWCRSSSL